MPATKWANLIYRVRIKIPFGVARLERHPQIEMIGRRPQTGKAYMRLLHKHHVLGSAALLKDGQDRMIILSSSRSLSLPLYLSCDFIICCDVISHHFLNHYA